VLNDELRFSTSFVVSAACMLNQFLHAFDVSVVLKFVSNVDTLMTFDARIGMNHAENSTTSS
jgi:hypothetical protein